MIHSIHDQKKVLHFNKNICTQQIKKFIQFYIYYQGDGKMRKKTFIINSITLSVTSLLMNAIGVSFNIYISNKIGASTVGLFQLIMSVYGFSVSLAQSGINLASTRLIADESAVFQKNANSYIMKRCIIYALLFGLLSCSLLYFNAEYIGKNWLCDTRTIISLKVLSISMPLISMSSAINGYFLAVKRVYKNAITQLFEQFVKIFFTVCTISHFAEKGVEYTCLCIVLGGCIGEILSFFFTFILYMYDKKKYKSNKTKNDVISSLFKIALPVAFSTYLRSALVTVEHILIPKGLKSSGLPNEESLKCYGTIHGMTIPLLLFPAAILKTVASLLVPELSQCATLGQKNQINHIITKIFKISIMFAIFVSGIFYSFADEISGLVYKNTSISYYIRLLAPLTVMMYIDGIVDGMLKGLNQQVNSMWYNIVDSVVSIVLIIILLPRYGSIGYIIVIYISELLNDFLSLNRLLKITEFKLNISLYIFIPSLIIYGCGYSIKSITNIIFTDRTVMLFILQIVSCLIIYICFIILLNKLSSKKTI